MTRYTQRVIVVVGGQFGDEGKGAFLDRLAGKAGLVVRYNGGANAGHSIENDRGKFALHLVPSGIFHYGVECHIGTGTVVDLAQLLDEIRMLQRANVDTGALRVSARAHLVMPWHKVLDKAREAERGGSAIGTTARGIGPCYADKVSRDGFRFGDLLLGDPFTAAFLDRAKEVGKHIPDFVSDFERGCETFFSNLEMYRNELGPLCADTDAFARAAWRAQKNILLEGAQGTMLDIDHGTYPYVTSSSVTSAGACVGSGLPPMAITDVMLVCKAYTTRVGAGPFPTELDDDIGNQLREFGHEFGTTTGRPRRCGWFDATQVRFAAEVNGATEIALTKLDVLTGIDPIRVCTSEGGERLFHDLPGWTENIRGVTSWRSLPRAARDYVSFLQENIGVPITTIGTGPHRDHAIQLNVPTL